MENYYLGLDLGTDSIGWAVTDKNYNIPKFKGNSMWGIRLLEGGNTAVERREFRSSRRRLERNKYRLNCLEMLFNEEISKKDIAFFQRLKDSALYDGDKNVSGKYSLFNDPDYTDKDYYKKYPTIYHLRKELIESVEPHDVRLVFLALHHIIKNRGHFLFDNDDLGKNGNFDFTAIFTELNEYIKSNSNYESEGFSCNDLKPVEDIIKNSSLTSSKKKEALIKEFALNKKVDVFEVAIVTLLSGATAKAKDLFNTDKYDDTEGKSICFKSGYDDKATTYESVFGENFELIEKLKAIYDWAILADILNGKEYISYAKVDTYEKHKRDLKLLKEYVKAYVPEKYSHIFNENSDKVSNYLSYSGYSSKNPVMKKCDQETFCDFLRKQLPKELLDEKYAQMYKEIETSSFMPKAVTKDNSVIPMQLNRAELEAILSNAKNYLPFLADRDSSGKTVSEKIIDIFKYRIPYYVGPLNKHSEKSWLVRTDEKIYPWNFENVVDADNSAEKFINNLTSKCTYLPKEDVIPKNSLLYSAFTVLNEINNIKIDGEEISVELKQGIYKDLFEKSNKVKVFDLKKYLASNGYMNIEITGIDTTIKGSLKPFIDLQNIDLSYSDKEEIIKSVTIFGDDKKLLKNRLKRLYGDRLTADDIKKISKLKYTGWSRLSEKLLTGIEAVLPSTGEYTNIIHALWETNDNLMQLLSSNYDFRKKIDEENGDSTFTSLREEIDNLYVSPKIKRPIYQAMQIVEEIVKIQGHDPKKIFIEVARDEGEKKRTVSRKQKLIELYKYCKKDEQKLYEQLCNTDENDFRRDALYLYYTQLGKCMYTGKPIELSEIYNNNIYDIDHIFPRSKIKDDSLNNRVLVLKAENAKKGNIYPINSSIRNNMLPFWKTLFDKGLISKEKFERLVRNQPLTDEELSSFVSRQLVETRQSTKAVAQLLKKRYHDTAVEYIKASLVSDFRQENDFVKSRDVNDFHHAKDAYLNIVVGNVYTVRSHLAHFIDNVQSGKWSVNKMFDYTTNGAWIVENNKSINIVKSNMAKNNIRFTRYAFKQTGGLFDQNPLKKGLGQVPRKKDMDIDKYGGYNKPSSAYFAFVEYKNSKGEIVRSFEPVDLYAEKEYIRNPQEFIKRKLGVDYVKIIIPCVKYNALISINGFRMHISSKSSGGANLICKPAVQLVVSQEQEKYIKKISSYLAKCAELRKEKEITSFDGITEKDNADLYETLKHKTNHTIYNVKFSKLANILIDKQCEFEGLSLYEQCYILMQIINILHANVMSGDLSAIGEAKKSGVTTISNKMQPSYKTVKLINQSISGLFEQEIDLLK